jgi:hypothetical protein
MPQPKPSHRSNPRKTSPESPVAACAPPDRADVPGQGVCGGWSDDLHGDSVNLADPVVGDWTYGGGDATRLLYRGRAYRLTRR